MPRLDEGGHHGVGAVAGELEVVVVGGALVGVALDLRRARCRCCS
jgi:hypothetical protein